MAWCLIKRQIRLHGTVLSEAQGQLYLYLYKPIVVKRERENLLFAELDTPRIMMHSVNNLSLYFVKCIMMNFIACILHQILLG
jgi:hypothetical protein